jgi:hypothetical protein
MGPWFGHAIGNCHGGVHIPNGDISMLKPQGIPIPRGHFRDVRVWALLKLGTLRWVPHFSATGHFPTVAGAQSLPLVETCLGTGVPTCQRSR